MIRQILALSLPTPHSLCRAIARGIIAEKKRIAAAMTAACFIFTSVIAQPALAIAEKKKESRRLDNIFAPSLIPESAGRVTGVRDSGGRRVAVVIQDLHCHEEVQRNISRVFELIDERWGLERIYVEGAAGELDTSWMDRVKNEKVRKILTEGLMKRGVLTGAEYYSMNSGRPDILFGLENDKTYRENLLRLEKITSSRDRIERILALLRKDLSAMKSRHYRAGSRRFDLLRERWRKGSIPPEKYHGLLRKYGEKLGLEPGRGYREYAALAGYRSLLDEGRKLRWKDISRELQSFMGAARAKLPYAVYQRVFRDAGSSGRSNEIYGYLGRIAKEYNIPTAGYPALDAFLKYMERSGAVDPLAVLREERGLSQAIGYSLARDEAERRVVFLSGYLEIAEDLLKGELSGDDHVYLLGRYDDFRLRWKQYADNDRFDELKEEWALCSDYYRVNRERNACFVNAITGNGPVNRSSPSREEDRVRAAPSPLEGEGRDEGTRGAKDVLDNANEVVGVVTGGFHTDEIARLLSDRGISCIIITPNVTTDAGKAGKIYQSLILAQARFLDQAFEPMLQTMLIKIYGEKPAEKMKERGETRAIAESVVSVIADVLINDTHPGRQDEAISEALQGILDNKEVYASLTAGNASGDVILKVQISGEQFVFNFSNDGKVEIQDRASAGGPLAIAGHQYRKLHDTGYRSIHDLDNWPDRLRWIAGEPLFWAPLWETAAIFVLRFALTFALAIYGIDSSSAAIASIAVTSLVFSLAHSDLWEKGISRKEFGTRFANRFFGGLLLSSVLGVSLDASAAIGAFISFMIHFEWNYGVVVNRWGRGWMKPLNALPARNRDYDSQYKKRVGESKFLLPVTINDIWPYLDENAADAGMDARERWARDQQKESVSGLLNNNNVRCLSPYGAIQSYLKNPEYFYGGYVLGYSRDRNTGKYEKTSLGNAMARLFNMATWEQGYRKYGLPVENPPITQYLEKIQADAILEGKPVIFFVPRNIMHKRNESKTREEFEWLLKNAKDLENVILVFGLEDTIDYQDFLRFCENGNDAHEPEEMLVRILANYKKHLLEDAVSYEEGLFGTRLANWPLQRKEPGVIHVTDKEGKKVPLRVIEANGLSRRARELYEESIIQNFDFRKYPGLNSAMDDPNNGQTNYRGKQVLFLESETHRVEAVAVCSMLEPENGRNAALSVETLWLSKHNDSNLSAEENGGIERRDYRGIGSGIAGFFHGRAGKNEVSGTGQLSDGSDMDTRKDMAESIIVYNQGRESCSLKVVDARDMSESERIRCARSIEEKFDNASEGNLSGTIERLKDGGRNSNTCILCVVSEGNNVEAVVEYSYEMPGTAGRNVLSVHTLSCAAGNNGVMAAWNQPVNGKEGRRFSGIESQLVPLILGKAMRAGNIDRVLVNHECIKRFSRGARYILPNEMYQWWLSKEKKDYMSFPMQHVRYLLSDDRIWMEGGQPRDRRLPSPESRVGIVEARNSAGEPVAHELVDARLLSAREKYNLVQKLREWEEYSIRKKVLLAYPGKIQEIINELQGWEPPGVSSLRMPLFLALSPEGAVEAVLRFGSVYGMGIKGINEGAAAGAVTQVIQYIEVAPWNRGTGRKHSGIGSALFRIALQRFEDPDDQGRWSTPVYFVEPSQNTKDLFRYLCLDEVPVWKRISIDGSMQVMENQQEVFWRFMSAMNERLNGLRAGPGSKGKRSNDEVPAAASILGGEYASKAPFWEWAYLVPFSSFLVKTGVFKKFISVLTGTDALEIGRKIGDSPRVKAFDAVTSLTVMGAAFLSVAGLSAGSPLLIAAGMMFSISRGIVFAKAHRWADRPKEKAQLLGLGILFASVFVMPALWVLEQGLALPLNQSGIIIAAAFLFSAGIHYAWNRLAATRWGNNHYLVPASVILSANEPVVAREKPLQLPVLLNETTLDRRIRRLFAYWDFHWDAFTLRDRGIICDVVEKKGAAGLDALFTLLRRTEDTVMTAEIVEVIAGGDYLSGIPELQVLALDRPGERKSALARAALDQMLRNPASSAVGKNREGNRIQKSTSRYRLDPLAGHFDRYMPERGAPRLIIDGSCSDGRSVSHLINLIGRSYPETRFIGVDNRMLMYGVKDGDNLGVFDANNNMLDLITTEDHWYAPRHRKPLHERDLVNEKNVFVRLHAALESAQSKYPEGMSCSEWTERLSLDLTGKVLPIFMIHPDALSAGRVDFKQGDIFNLEHTVGMKKAAMVILTNTVGFHWGYYDQEQTFEAIRHAGRCLEENGILIVGNNDEQFMGSNGRESLAWHAFRKKGSDLFLIETHGNPRVFGERRLEVGGKLKEIPLNAEQYGMINLWVRQNGRLPQPRTPSDIVSHWIADMDSGEFIKPSLAFKKAGAAASGELLKLLDRVETHTTYAASTLHNIGSALIWADDITLLPELQERWRRAPASDPRRAVYERVLSAYLIGSSQVFTRSPKASGNISRYTSSERLSSLKGELGPFLEGIKSPVIVNAGCSSGLTSVSLEEMCPGSRVIGVDIDHELQVVRHGKYKAVFNGSGEIVRLYNTDPLRLAAYEAGKGWQFERSREDIKNICIELYAGYRRAGTWPEEPIRQLHPSVMDAMERPGSGITFRQGDIFSLSGSLRDINNEADVVVCANVLGYWGYYDEQAAYNALREMGRNLREGGRLIAGSNPDNKKPVAAYGDEAAEDFRYAVWERRGDMLVLVSEQEGAYIRKNAREEEVGPWPVIPLYDEARLVKDIMSSLRSGSVISDKDANTLKNYAWLGILPELQRLYADDKYAGIRGIAGDVINTLLTDTEWIWTETVAGPVRKTTWPTRYSKLIPIIEDEAKGHPSGEQFTVADFCGSSGAAAALLAERLSSIPGARVICMDNNTHVYSIRDRAGTAIVNHQGIMIQYVERESGVLWRRDVEGSWERDGESVSEGPGTGVAERCTALWKKYAAGKYENRLISPGTYKDGNFGETLFKDGECSVIAIPLIVPRAAHPVRPTAPLYFVNGDMNAPASSIPCAGVDVIVMMNILGPGSGYYTDRMRIQELMGRAGYCLKPQGKLFVGNTAPDGSPGFHIYELDSERGCLVFKGTQGYPGVFSVHYGFVPENNGMELINADRDEGIVSAIPVLAPRKGAPEKIHSVFSEEIYRAKNLFENGTVRPLSIFGPRREALERQGKKTARDLQNLKEVFFWITGDRLIGGPALETAYLLVLRYVLIGALSLAGIDAGAAPAFSGLAAGISLIMAILFAASHPDQWEKGITRREFLIRLVNRTAGGFILSLALWTAPGIYQLAGAAASFGMHALWNAWIIHRLPGSRRMRPLIAGERRNAPRTSVREDKTPVSLLEFTGASGMTVITLDQFNTRDLNAVRRAVGSGHIIKFDMTGIDKNDNEALINIRHLIEGVAGAVRAEVVEKRLKVNPGNVKTVIREDLKNAFVHGNKMTGAPVYLYIDSKKPGVYVFDCAIAETDESYKQRARETGLSGFGLGGTVTRSPDSIRFPRTAVYLEEGILTVVSTEYITPEPVRLVMFGAILGESGRYISAAPLWEWIYVMPFSSLLVKTGVFNKFINVLTGMDAREIDRKIGDSPRVKAFDAVTSLTVMGAALLSVAGLSAGLPLLIAVGMMFSISRGIVFAKAHRWAGRPEEKAQLLGLGILFASVFVMPALWVLEQGLALPLNQSGVIIAAAFLFSAGLHYSYNRLAGTQRGKGHHLVPAHILPGSQPAEVTPENYRLLSMDEAVGQIEDVTGWLASVDRRLKSSGSKGIKRPAGWPKETRRDGAWVDLSGVPDEKLIIVGDLHGRVDRLVALLEEDGNFDKIIKGERILVIAGDALHNERDPEEMRSSIVMLQAILRLMRMAGANGQESVYYLMGNHELAENRLYKNGIDQPGAFREEIHSQYGASGYYSLYRELVRVSPLGAIGRDFVITHAGPPKKDTEKSGSLYNAIRDYQPLDDESDTPSALSTVFTGRPETRSHLYESNYSREDVEAGLHELLPGQPNARWYAAHTRDPENTDKYHSGWHWKLYDGKLVITHAAGGAAGYLIPGSGGSDYFKRLRPADMPQQQDVIHLESAPREQVLAYIDRIADVKKSNKRMAERMVAEMKEASRYDCIGLMIERYRELPESDEQRKDIAEIVEDYVIRQISTSNPVRKNHEILRWTSRGRLENAQKYILKYLDENPLANAGELRFAEAGCSAGIETKAMFDAISAATGRAARGIGIDINMTCHYVRDGEGNSAVFDYAGKALWACAASGRWYVRGKSVPLSEFTMEKLKNVRGQLLPRIHDGPAGQGIRSYSEAGNMIETIDLLAPGAAEASARDTGLTFIQGNIIEPLSSIIEKKVHVVVAANILSKDYEYYSSETIEEILGKLGTGLEEGGIMLVGNNTAANSRALHFLVFQRIKNRLCLIEGEEEKSGVWEGKPLKTITIPEPGPRQTEPVAGRGVLPPQFYGAFDGKAEGIGLFELIDPLELPDDRRIEYARALDKWDQPENKSVADIQSIILGREKGLTAGNRDRVLLAVSRDGSGKMSVEAAARFRVIRKRMYPEYTFRSIDIAPWNLSGADERRRHSDMEKQFLYRLFLSAREEGRFDKGDYYELKNSLVLFLPNHGGISIKDKYAKMFKQYTDKTGPVFSLRPGISNHYFFNSAAALKRFFEGMEREQEELARARVCGAKGVRTVPCRGEMDDATAVSLIEAVREGQLIVLDISSYGTEDGRFDELHTLFFDIAYCLGSNFQKTLWQGARSPVQDGFETITPGFFLLEMLKNAYVHGNRLENRSIAFHIDLEERKITVFDDHLEPGPDNGAMEKAKKSGLWGKGRGVPMMSGLVRKDSSRAMCGIKLDEWVANRALPVKAVYGRRAEDGRGVQQAAFHLQNVKDPTSKHPLFSQALLAGLAVTLLFALLAGIAPDVLGQLAAAPLPPHLMDQSAGAYAARQFSGHGMFFVSGSVVIDVLRRLSGKPTGIMSPAQVIEVPHPVEEGTYISRLERAIEILSHSKYRDGAWADLRDPDKYGKTTTDPNAPAPKDVIIVGELHGRNDNLEAILADNDNEKKIVNGERTIIILGDAIHDKRNRHNTQSSLDTMDRIIRLMIEARDNGHDTVFFLPGNHEWLDLYMKYGKNNPGRFFKEHVDGIEDGSYYDKLKEFISRCPIAAVGDNFGAAHAGAPVVKDKESMFYGIIRGVDPSVNTGVINWMLQNAEPEKFDKNDVEKWLVREMGLPRDNCMFYISHTPSKNNEEWYYFANGRTMVQSAFRDNFGYVRLVGGRREIIDLSPRKEITLREEMSPVKRGPTLVASVVLSLAALPVLAAVFAGFGVDPLLLSTAFTVGAVRFAGIRRMGGPAASPLSRSVIFHAFLPERETEARAIVKELADNTSELGTVHLNVTLGSAEEELNPENYIFSEKAVVSCHGEMMMVRLMVNKSKRDTLYLLPEDGKSFPEDAAGRELFLAEAAQSISDEIRDNGPLRHDLASQNTPGRLWKLLTGEADELRPGAVVCYDMAPSALRQDLHVSTQDPAGSVLELVASAAEIVHACGALKPVRVLKEISVSPENAERARARMRQAAEQSYNAVLLTGTPDQVSAFIRDSESLLHEIRRGGVQLYAQYAVKGAEDLGKIRRSDEHIPLEGIVIDMKDVRADQMSPDELSRIRKEHAPFAYLSIRNGEAHEGYSCVRSMSLGGSVPGMRYNDALVLENAAAKVIRHKDAEEWIERARGAANVVIVSEELDKLGSPGYIGTLLAGLNMPFASSPAGEFNSEKDLALAMESVDESNGDLREAMREVLSFAVSQEGGTLNVPDADRKKFADAGLSLADKLKEHDHNSLALHTEQLFREGNTRPAAAAGWVYGMAAASSWRSVEGTGTPARFVSPEMEKIFVSRLFEHAIGTGDDVPVDPEVKELDLIRAEIDELSKLPGQDEKIRTLIQKAVTLTGGRKLDAVSLDGLLRIIAFSDRKIPLQRIERNRPDSQSLYHAILSAA